MSTVTPPDPLPPDENVGPVLLAVSGVLISLIIVTSSLRLWVRYALRSLGWDDYLLGVITCLAIGRFSLQIAQFYHGNGRHRWYISAEDYVTNNMLGWFTQILLFAGICLLKCSIMLLILRIKDSRGLRWLLSIVMAGLVITNFGCIVILLAECSPVEAYWTGVGYCWEAKVRIYSIYFTIAYSILTDMLCSLLPLVVVWKVRIPMKTKMYVCGLMSLGLLATGFGIARAASLGLVTDDLSWTYCIAAIWSNLELFLGIIAANLALSRQVYVYFFGDKSRSASNSYAHSNPYHSGHANTKLRDDQVHHPDTLIESRRRPSASQSDHSEIPLEPGIQKKTEFWLTEEDVADRVPKRPS